MLSASSARGSRAVRFFGRARWTGNDYAGLAREGYQKNAVAYRCVRMIAEAAASAPFQVFVDGARDDVHPLARLLAKPNPEQSGAELMEAVYGALQVSGNAYVEAIGPEAQQKAVVALHKRLTEVQPYRLLGQFDQPYTRRSNVSGFVPGPVLTFWNVEKK